MEKSKQASVKTDNFTPVTMVNGETTLLGLIGWPVGHSLSPVMHNTALYLLGLNYIYVPMPVEPGRLAQAIQGLRALHCGGFNVTIPHKVAVMPFLDQLDDTAQAVGAVNTVVMRQGRLIGYNTDGAGFIRALAAAGIKVSGKRAVLLGAGGAARSILYALLVHGATATVAARQPVKAQAMVHSLGAAARKVVVCSWDDAACVAALSHCDLCINCTPIGMAPHVDAMPPVNLTVLPRQAVVCDVVYNPPVTALLAEAARLGYRTVPGTGMLVQQGVLAFELWTGQHGVETIMAQTVRKILAGS